MAKTKKPLTNNELEAIVKDTNNLISQGALKLLAEGYFLRGSDYNWDKKEWEPKEDEEDLDS